jgi:hypothetical protein
MSCSCEKRRRTCTFQPELLERREVLSIAALPGQTVHDVIPLAKSPKEVFGGSLTGTAFVSATSSVAGTLDFAAEGTLTILGVSHLTGSDSYSVSKHGAVKYKHGASTLANSLGETLDATFTGSGKVTGDSVSFKDKGKVTGGTGADAGAAGTFAASGSFNDVTDAFSETITITLKKT